MGQLIANGIALGAIYVLASLGFVIIFNVSGAVNFAHGNLVVLGGFLGVALADLLRIPVWADALVVACAMAAIGALLERVAFAPLRNQPFATVFISTLAVGIVIANATLLIFGPEPRSGRPLVGGQTQMLGVSVPNQSLVIVGVMLALVILQRLVFRRTTIGANLRAIAEDADAAELLGIRSGLVRMGGYAVAVALAGIAGVLLAPQTYVQANDGSLLVLKIYIAVVIGGFGSEAGAVVGGLALGLVEVLVAGYVTSAYRDAVVFGLLLLFLAVRPEGIFGQVQAQRL